MEKIGRNDPCTCGSGKKFKKCCANKMIGRKFLATKIDTVDTSSRISSFFQNNVIPTSKPEDVVPAEKENEKTEAEKKEESAIENTAVEAIEDNKNLNIS